MIWESKSYEQGVPESSRRNLSYYGERDPYEQDDDDALDDGDGPPRTRAPRSSSYLLPTATRPSTPT